MEQARALAKWESELEGYRKGGNYNILVPTMTIQEISPFHKPVLEIVRINPDPKEGEVYEIVNGSGDFCLKAVALQKIGYAAGLIWNAKGCGRTDDGTNPEIVSYRMEAAVRKEDGTYMPLSQEYMLDLAVQREEIVESYEKKSKDLAKKERWGEPERKAYVEKMVKRDMLQKRKFRLQLAQTGAMDRVIRKILGLKSTYKAAELSKPFVVPKIAFNPDVNDPKVRELLLRQGLDATTVLFGSSAEKPMLDYQQPVCPEPEKAIDVTPTDPEEPHGEALAKTEPTKAFDQMDAKEQTAALRGLMKKKGYAETRLKRALDAFSDADRKKFFDHLSAMPDVVEELPFE